MFWPLQWLDWMVFRALFLLFKGVTKKYQKYIDSQKKLRTGAILFLCKNYQVSLQYKKRAWNPTPYPRWWKEDTKLCTCSFPMFISLHQLLVMDFKVDEKSWKSSQEFFLFGIFKGKTTWRTMKTTKDSRKISRIIHCFPRIKYPNIWLSHNFRFFSA